MLVFRRKILGEIQIAVWGPQQALEAPSVWSYILLESSRFPLRVGLKIISICSNGEFALALVDPVLYQTDRNKLWLSDNENLSDEEEG